MSDENGTEQRTKKEKSGDRLLQLEETISLAAIKAAKRERSRSGQHKHALTRIGELENRVAELETEIEEVKNALRQIR